MHRREHSEIGESKTRFVHSLLLISDEKLEQQRQEKKKVFIVSKDTDCPEITLASSENLRGLGVVHCIAYGTHFLT